MDMLDISFIVRFSAAKDKSENNRKSNVNVSPPAMHAPVRVDKK